MSEDAREGHRAIRSGAATQIHLTELPSIFAIFCANCSVPRPPQVTLIDRRKFARAGRTRNRSCCSSCNERVSAPAFVLIVCVCESFICRPCLRGLDTRPNKTTGNSRGVLGGSFSDLLTWQTFARQSIGLHENAVISLTLRNATGKVNFPIHARRHIDLLPCYFPPAAFFENS